MSGRLRGAGIAAGAVGALAGATYAAQRFAAARVRRRPDADEARVLEAPIYVDHRLETFDRGTMYVVEAGEGPPIVLSHGVTLSVRTWFHQLELLPKEGFRVLAYDHRGHGQSVLGEAGHSLENLAEDVNTVVTQLDLRGAVLVGHSMGGVAVQAFVARYPRVVEQRVAGIVLVSTLAHTPFGSRSTRTKARIERWTNHVPDMTWLWNARNLGLVAARLGFGKDPYPSHVELVRRMMAECPPDTRRDAPRVLVGLDLTADLPKFRVPTLVVGGTADLLTPAAESRRMARLIPGARLELFEDAGHMLMLERTTELNELIVQFAREVGERGAVPG
jgi:non-heme chloroperoxidase